MDEGERLVRDGHDQYRMLGRRTSSVSIGILIRSNSFLFWGAVTLALLFCFPWCAGYRVGSCERCELTLCLYSHYRPIMPITNIPIPTESHRPTSIQIVLFTTPIYIYSATPLSRSYPLLVTATATKNINRVRYHHGLCSLNIGPRFSILATLRQPILGKLRLPIMSRSSLTFPGELVSR